MSSRSLGESRVCKATSNVLYLGGGALWQHSGYYFNRRSVSILLQWENKLMRITVTCFLRLHPLTHYMEVLLVQHLPLPAFTKACTCIRTFRSSCNNNACRQVMFLAYDGKIPPGERRVLAMGQDRNTVRCQHANHIGGTWEQVSNERRDRDKVFPQRGSSGFL